jgi:hypothetical protein
MSTTLGLSVVQRVAYKIILTYWETPQSWGRNVFTLQKSLIISTTDFLNWMSALNVYYNEQNISVKVWL